MHLVFTFQIDVIKNKQKRSSRFGSAVMNPTSTHEDTGSIPGPSQWVKGSGVAKSCSVGQRCSSDPTLLWLWCRPTAAAAPIQSLAWELLYAAGAALKRKRKKKLREPKHHFQPLDSAELGVGGTSGLGSSLTMLPSTSPWHGKWLSTQTSSGGPASMPLVLSKTTCISFFLVS